MKLYCSNFAVVLSRFLLSILCFSSLFEISIRPVTIKTMASFSCHYGYAYMEHHVHVRILIDKQ